MNLIFTSPPESENFFLYFSPMVERPNNPAFKNSRLNRAIWVIETSLGHAFSHIRWFVQLSNPQSSISLSMASTCRVASGCPWGSSANWDTLALTNSMADAFGQDATQAPGPAAEARGRVHGLFGLFLGNRQSIGIRCAAGINRDIAPGKEI